MFIEGYLDGNSTLINCRVGDLNYVRGCVDRCVLNGSSITLLGDAIFLDSFSGNPADGVPEINLGGSGKSLILKNYNGSIKLINKTGSEESEIDLNSGVVQLDNTVTGGTVHVRGVGTVEANGATATINTTGLLNTDTISTGVMAETVEGSLDLQAALQILLAVIAGKATGGGTTAITFRNTADDTNRVVMTVDTNGNRSSVVLTT